MKKVVSYIEICSNSLLALSDLVDDPIHFNDKIYIDLKNKEIRKLFNDILINTVKAEREYGKDIILINTCQPKNNWRIKNGQNLPQTSFSFTCSVIANSQLLQMEIDKIWHTLKRSGILHDSFKLLDHQLVEFSEIRDHIKHLVGNVLCERKTSEFTLKDSNLTLVKNMEKIKDPVIFHEIEVLFYDKKLIS